LKSEPLGIRIQPCDPVYMPKGPQGQKRPADVIGAAVQVMKIATGEISDNPLPPEKLLSRRGGLIGGRKRAAKFSKKQRVQISLEKPLSSDGLSPANLYLQVSVTYLTYRYDLF